ncbi:MAG: hypothetical protein CVU26_02485 [Betaproteobacteria bacterium HGW-Betaproteobacteria-2]|jgi:uncharacterized repeat protein (TIGR03899 family)|nr:MAG: hypothetical protein CVU26_02485 [Betaproteobacteria bacterium HGW-Betaproteobacteria-2]PKP58321.1 MAG: hypothetical protein CVT91_08785 [Candidatus Atribacteria bacterium HGW-Atribacteria-1]
MLEQSSSIIDLKGISEPASKLIEAVSNAIGAVYAPTHLRRMAKAQADADIIQAESHIEKELILKRASERIVKIESKRQRNIESINDKALNELPEEANGVPPNEDWMQEFYNLCQDVSDDDLQIIWARILAGEVSTPGQFSIRALQILKTLSTREATLFFNYCSGVFKFIGHDEIIFARVIGFQTNQILYTNMTHMDVIHLAELGLVSYKDMKTVIRNHVYQEFEEMEYFDKSYLIKDSLSWVNPVTWFNIFRTSAIELEFLTELGAELFKVAKGIYETQQLKAVEKVLWESGISMELKPTKDFL